MSKGLDYHVNKEVIPVMEMFASQHTKNES